MSLGAQEDFTDEESKILASLLEGNDEPTSAETVTAPVKEEVVENSPETTTGAATAEVPPAKNPEPDDKSKGDPRAALRASRHAERTAKQEAERLKAENEELRKKLPATADADATTMTDAEIEELAQDFPIAAKAARTAKEAKAAIDALTKAQQQPAKTVEPEFRPPALPAEVQDVVDTNPDLLAWQHDPDQSRFGLSIQMDGLLRAHPKWGKASLEDRFKEVVRRVNAELTDSDSSLEQQTPATPRKDPAEVVKAAKRQTPSTLSDVGAGHAGGTDGLTLERMQKMSDEEIVNALIAEG